MHGGQEGGFFHGHYARYCFPPTYVFCGDHLLAAYLRPSNIDSAKHALAVLGLLVKRTRQSWPDVRIIYRADSGFCRWKAMRCCEKNNVDYILDLAQNKRGSAKPILFCLKPIYAFDTGRKQKLFGAVCYGARKWDRERRVIVKAKRLKKSVNPRYVVTSPEGGPVAIYQEY